MSAGRTFVDTNVLTYLFDDSEAEKQQAARLCLEREQHDQRELVLSTQILQELYVSLTKGDAPIASSEIAEAAVREAAGYYVVQVDPQLVLSAIDAARRHVLSFWDALVVRAAAEARCERILSEDLSPGQVIDGVRVDNPFG